jgi:O-acetyl-ADP-ribose deacetylase (regulator of RNase III)
VDDLVMQMLAYRPEDRFRSPLDVIDRLPRYGTVISAVVGDLTAIPADAVVCSANDLMAMNLPGSSAHAVLAAGGETILAEALARRPVAVGDVVVTAGGRLPADRVLHAVIVHADDRGVLQPLVERDLRKALWGVLRRAHELHLHSIVLPALGVMLGRLAPDESARILVDVVHTYLLEFRPPLERITFVLEDKLVTIAFREAAIARGMILV